MILLKTETEIKHVSKQRDKSLILRIPANIRDVMEYEHGTPITVEVHVENNEKYLKIKTD